jgi:hypothetical protein
MLRITISFKTNLPFLLAPVLIFLASTAWAATYYVDATIGRDTNNGLSEATPWKTISKVNALTFQPQDQILFRRGAVWREQLNVTSSGRPESQITFGAYGTGDAPVFNGSDIVGNWTEKKPLQEMGGVFSTGLELETSAFTTDFTRKFETGGNTVTVETSVVHGGTNAIKCTFDGTNLDCNAQKIIPDQGDLYIRAYVRRNSEFSFARPNYNYLPILQFYDTAAPSTAAWVGITSSPNKDGTRIAFIARFRRAGGYTTLYRGLDNFAPNRWYLIEAHWVRHKAVGGMQLWINKTSVAANFTQDTSSYTVNNILIGGSRVGSSKAPPTNRSEIYVDDVKVDTSPVGAASVYRSYTWEAPLTTKPSQVFFDGDRGHPVSGLSDLEAPNQWYWTHNKLFVYSQKDPRTRYHSPGIEASARGTCLRLWDVSYITVQGIELRGANYYGLLVRATFANSNQITVKNSKTWQNHFDGIRIEASGSSITNVQIIANEVTYNNGHGIRIGENCSSILIDANEVHHNSLTYGTGLLTSTAGIRVNSGDASTHTVTIQNNLVHSNGDGLPSGVYNGKGIWIDNSGPNIIVRRNRCYANHNNGIFVEAQDGVKVYYNLSYINGGHGISLRAGTNANAIYNNVCYKNTYAGIEINGVAGVKSKAYHNSIKNNISLENGIQLIAINGGENDGINGAGNTYSHNCLGPEYANFIEWGKTGYMPTYATWETAYGADTYSLKADPVLTAPSKGDFKLHHTSVCVDAGIDVGLTMDFEGGRVPFGSAPDVGAYEYYHFSRMRTP